MNKIELIEVKCNLCGSDEYKIMYKPWNKQYDSTQVFSASGGIMGTQQIVRCTNCGLVYVNPRLKESNVVDAYSNSEDELYVSQSQLREKTFLSSLKLVNKYCPKKGHLLDVGCAAGFFVNTAKKDGWQVSGVEPSKWLTEWGTSNLNVEIRNGVLRDVNYESESFDAVTMWDVLEHTSDPNSEVKEVNRILKDNGIFIINFPDVGTWLAKLAGKRWWFFLSVHLYHFTPRTLSHLLKKNGFCVLSVKPHFQTLSLGHLLKMVGLYNKPISNFCLKLSKVLHVENLPIPYYASQTNIIAQKTN